jgi:hypothetical protein
VGAAISKTLQQFEANVILPAARRVVRHQGDSLGVGDDGAAQGADAFALAYGTAPGRILDALTKNALGHPHCTEGASSDGAFQRLR